MLQHLQRSDDAQIQYIRFGNGARPRPRADAGAKQPSGPCAAAPIGGDYSHATTGSADRSMPDTASGWLDLLVGGGLLGAAGVRMRRLMARG